MPGHEEIELALVKLYQATGQERYLALAKFFIDLRGDRPSGELWGAYSQDHMPVRQQSEIVGHAVRAMYLYSGAADVAAYTGDQESDRRHGPPVAGRDAAEDVHHRRHRRPA